ncbi:E3 ubiquitin-protein ligase UHRF1 [Mycena vitilis]|nr:E3 ubiquitin-protein ligase UHRF1 [Mycena vitilis]
MNEFEFPAPSKELPVFTKSQNKPKPDHDPRRYGEIPGALVGSTFPSRHACWKAGVHGHTQAGIHGSESAPAYSIVMSGRYADDCDQGDTFIYSGEGGRSKEVAGKSKFFGERCANQVWNRGNKSLQLSHATGRPVRVIRGHMLHSRYAPAEGFRYDGLYRVTQVVYGDGKTGDGKNGFKTSAA